MRYKRFDLNLLVVLDALLREKSVSRAAEHLNLSQPAISAALGRVRQHLNDEILVLHGKTMVPTAHALSMAPIVSRALADIDALITASTVFDPATSRRRFRVCASDYVTVVLLAPLMVDLAKIAPGLSFDICPPGPEVMPKFERGEIDLMLTPMQFTADNHPRHLLFEERHVVVGCSSNPVLQAPLTEDAFFNEGHVVIELDHSQTYAEQALGALNRHRQIEVVCPSFLAVPWVLLNSRLLAVMHERLARMMVNALPLTMVPMPIELPPMPEMVQHHAARNNDAGIQWLLQRLMAKAAEL